MISKSFLRSLLSSFLVFGMILGSASAAKFNLRATANSNENDEDYDGLVVFKNYVEAASNGAISESATSIGLPQVDTQAGVPVLAELAID